MLEKNAPTAVPKWNSIAHYKTSAKHEPLFEGNWIVEEKIDGSQLSFAWDSAAQTVLFRNKNSASFLSGEAPYLNKTFGKTMASLLPIGSLLNSDYVYHGEAMRSSRHNRLLYQRAPRRYFILFDIKDKQTGHYLSYEEKCKEAKRLDLEIPSLYLEGAGIDSAERAIAKIMAMIEKGDLESALGGNPEGIVIKNYTNVKNETGRPPMLKSVRTEFKEAVARKFTSAEKRFKITPSTTVAELCQYMGGCYNTEARWQKAVQHLDETGQLHATEGEMKAFGKDVKLLVQELDRDLFKEYEEEIKVDLLSELFPRIAAEGRKGFTAFYRQLCLQKPSLS
eukprot:TRINITY_DN696_c0_g1_i1.p2 TRINITY_DN696_c0_g1~~TRINITY_DN696_c0_g1_i1.p2  ORF type:complete len:337 (-),score=60.06 TRINITY_DN696_c0_g1_i1:2034-3044(-)